MSVLTRCVAGVLLIALISASAASSASAATFSVSVDAPDIKHPVSGRLVVYCSLIKIGRTTAAPAEIGFDERDPQRLFGCDVRNLKPSERVVIDDSADAFPQKLSGLTAGRYRVQAVLDRAADNSDWQKEPGNLFSDPANVEVSADDQSIELVLNHVVKPRPVPQAANVKLFNIESKQFRDGAGRPLALKAGVVLPNGYDEHRTYPAIYKIPGFGSDHYAAFDAAAERFALANAPASPAKALAESCFLIVLDPESGNGHTLFVDSACNGPRARVLIEEFIPALEAQYRLIPNSSARIVTGHSSGGWSSLWLATQYPQTFGACWASSPDPVDFRKFEQVDIYSAANMFVDAGGRDTSSIRFDGVTTMTVRQENGMEQVLGPRNDSSQQWDSWQSCFGQRGADGHPRPLYDPITGAIDHAEAESYRHCDITDLLRRDPKKYAPLFRRRVHLIVGGADTYFLNEAVEPLQRGLDEFDPNGAGGGYIKIVPDADHHSIHNSAEARAWPAEMLSYLTAPATQP